MYVFVSDFCTLLLGLSVDAGTPEKWRRVGGGGSRVERPDSVVKVELIVGGPLVSTLEEARIGMYPCRCQKPALRKTSVTAGRRMLVPQAVVTPALALAYRQ